MVSRSTCNGNTYTVFAALERWSNVEVDTLVNIRLLVEFAHMVKKSGTQLKSRKPSEIDKIIGERLRARRRLLSLSQEQLAQQCNISAQQIHKYEVNQSRIAVGRLAQFADVLGVPVVWFFDGLGDHEEFSDDVIDLISNPDYVELFLLLEQANNRGYTEGLLAMVRRHVDDREAEQELATAVHRGRRAL